MAKQQRNHRTPVGVIAGIAAVAVAAGGGAAWWTWNSTQSPTPSPAPNTAQQVPPVSQAEQTAQTFWLRSTGNKLELVPKPIATTADRPPSTALETAFNNLLAGPNDPSVSTTIPRGTKLRSVKMENDGIHVDLSEQFTTGGGSASMTGRVAQVLYTATSLQPNAQVWIDVEGKPLEVLGGEGLVLEQPLTRQSFQQNFTL
ncbi:GerMN domain-containing protein [Chroococcidiopsis sp. CCMEE 29]|uniref:GerMN domain-containing protein n=1 Tax=Chroococcidiopsis sp. CCMEE 29 TaxID=155894 RepID=UPI0020218709|nr:GerMN domain-containing protein [Chroococcidiopsis sp. CCMEE 29]